MSRSRHCTATTAIRFTRDTDIPPGGTCAPRPCALASPCLDTPQGYKREDEVMTRTSAATDWHLRGDWFDVCSCKLPCPCSFAQAPTHGDCLFTLVWHVREGHFGEVDLAGLNVVS